MFSEAARKGPPSKPEADLPSKNTRGRADNRDTVCPDCGGRTSRVARVLIRLCFPSASDRYMSSHSSTEAGTITMAMRTARYNQTAC